MRIGYGYDIHQLVNGRKLMLGGVEIPFKKGLLGHSDADVLIHAMCDAILGAAGLDDVGAHFPDTDPAFKGVDSLILLVKSCDMIRNSGYSIVNIDSTVIAQVPKLSPFRESMRKKIAAASGMDIKNINIKFTTNEGLGCIGEEKGIAALCVALID